MTDPDAIALSLAVLMLVALCLVIAAGVQWLVTPRRRTFRQRDHVAARKRAITHRGFKTRAGIRQ